MIVKYKKLLASAQEPMKATAGSACFDLCAAEDVMIHPGDVVAVRTGLAVEVPCGFVLKLYVRSGMAKEGIILANGTGIIDSDYRGEVKVLLANVGFDGRWKIIAGQRIAQCELVEILPTSWYEDSELSNTTRGEGGFGSTGK